MRTKAGRLKAHRRLERRVAARRGVEGCGESGAALPATPDAAAEGLRDVHAPARSPEADDVLASRADLRMRESKSRALPLGDTPTSLHEQQKKVG